LLRFAGVKLEISGKMLVSDLSIKWLAHTRAFSLSVPLSRFTPQFGGGSAASNGI
jgi:hypothetical protein